MGVVIGGLHIVTRASTIPIPRPTVVLTMATVITTARRIMTTTPEPMDGTGVLLVRTDPPVGVQVIILTRERTHEAVLFRLLMAPEVPHKRIIHIPARMRRRDKVPVPQLNGAARM